MLWLCSYAAAAAAANTAAAAVAAAYLKIGFYILIFILGII